MMVASIEVGRVIAVSQSVEDAQQVAVIIKDQAAVPEANSLEPSREVEAFRNNLVQKLIPRIKNQPDLLSRLPTKWEQTLLDPKFLDVFMKKLINDAEDPDGKDYDEWLETRLNKDKYKWLVRNVDVLNAPIHVVMAQIARGIQLSSRLTGTDWTGNRRT